MEWTNFKNLKKGEKYRIIFESYDFEMIFCYYSYRGKYGYCENCDAVFKEKLNLSKGWTHTTVDDSFEYYKFISKKEYNEKIRDKYDEKVLNIVLKQIVNDDFKW
jgi:predicted nucleic acid-binding protein